MGVVGHIFDLWDPQKRWPTIFQSKKLQKHFWPLEKRANWKIEFHLCQNNVRPTTSKRPYNGLLKIGSPRLFFVLSIFVPESNCCWIIISKCVTSKKGLVKLTGSKCSWLVRNLWARVVGFFLPCHGEKNKKENTSPPPTQRVWSLCVWTWNR